MTEKQNTSLEISGDNIPEILRVRGEEKNPNLQDVPNRDISGYLREQYWIKQWGPTKRWGLGFVNGSCGRQLRLADLNRKLDDPGDAFFALSLGTLRSSVSVRIWVEVTEVFLPEHAPKVNRFIREYNDLRGKGDIDAAEFLNSLELGRPDFYMQREMADKVIAAIERKAKKGREKGSYKSLVSDYGRGQLIVGLPLWFATYPSDATDPSMALKDFCVRLGLGLDAIKNSILHTSWCPFDSIVVLWNPTLQAVDEWAKIADPGFYSDPANYSWKTPVSLLGNDSFFRKAGLLKPNNIRSYLRWDRYSSLDAMLADQRRWLRFPGNPRPLGPKACLKIDNSDIDVSTLRTAFYIRLFQLWLFVRINGWRDLRRWVVYRFSVRRLYSRLLRGHQARKLYRSSLSNRSKSNVNNRAD